VGVATSVPAEHGEPDAGTTTEAAAPARGTSSKVAPHKDDEPPAISVQALCAEIHGNGGDSNSDPSLAAERKRLAEERTRLEKLAADIAQARFALQSETTRLEALVKQSDAKSETPAPAPPPVAKAPLPAERGPPAEPPPPAHVRPEVVAKALRGLKPDQAALVLKKLHHPLAAQVLSRMRAEDAAAVIGKLEPGEAADLLTQAASAE
jgi:flagellar motility protein MotE (MotC chaperone)